MVLCVNCSLAIQDFISGHLCTHIREHLQQNRCLTCSWDEWVPESRMMKYNEQNKTEQMQLLKLHTLSQTAPAKTKINKLRKNKTLLNRKQKIDTTTFKRQNSSSDVLKKKRVLESEKQFINTEVKMPDELNSWLLDDWHLITRQSKLVNIPAKISVDDIMNNYIIHKKQPYRRSTITQFTMGWKNYFNDMLGTQLLYRFERQQHADILQQHPNTPVSKVYGPIHLLRLFVKLGSMLDVGPLKEHNIQPLQHSIQDFLEYMVDNSATLFSLQDYGNPSPEYQQKVVEDSE